MKILHTADWHIGKHLYKKDLNIELVFYFDFLIQTVEREGVDVLLISGDIFDSSTPSNEDRALYYNVLSRFVKLGTKVILTAGNHDSISQLTASGELLKILNIRVLGNITDNFDDLVVELYENDEVCACVLAVPYLRDSDFRRYGKDSIFNKHEEIRAKVINYYNELSQFVRKKFDTEIPIIAMGHLFVTGGLSSESEREIEVGTLGGVAIDDLKNVADYFALGHLHRPQSLGDGSIRYSGSPISLSFSERNDKKSMFLLQIDSNNIEVLRIEIPAFRKLYRLTGTVDEVKEKLLKLQESTTLKHYVELEIVETKENPDAIYQLEEIVQANENAPFEILQYRVNFPSKTQNEFQQEIHLSLDEMTPAELFDELIAGRNMEEMAADELKNSFRELLSLFYTHSEKL